MVDYLLLFGSIFIVSLISLIGVLTISFKENFFKKILIYLVSFSAGALFGGAFIHLLPETTKEFGFGIQTGLFLLSGIVLFFFIEKIIKWHHCHGGVICEHKHSFSYMNLIGDGVHNFIDGLIIAGSYIVSIPLGITTTLAVAFHEIPQEIGDFAILVHGGFSKKRALIFNFLSALTAFIGAITIILVGGFFENVSMFLLPFTAGGFIYIAGSDLIPELHKELALRVSIGELIAFIIGIGLMLLLALNGG